MATAFSEQEKSIINKRLKEVAKEFLTKYGVKKTTIDQLVQEVGISKGAFYSFYESKEILFFHVMEDYQINLINDIKTKIENKNIKTAKEWTTIYIELMKNVRSSFLINLLKNNELELMMRKIPQEKMIVHHELDEVFMEMLFSHVKLKETVSFNTIATSFRMIFMTLLHEKEIGEKDFNEALTLLIFGLFQQIVKED